MQTSYFYPRPPRGGRLKIDMEDAGIAAISIHALREEGDYTVYIIDKVFFYFYPRPPRGGRRQVGSIC